MFLANLDPRAVLYEDKWPSDLSWFTALLILKFLYQQLKTFQKELPKTAKTFAFCF